MIKAAHKILPLFTLILFNVFSSEALAQKSSVSLEEASEMIRHSTQGKVLSAKTNDNNGAQSHRIRVLTPSGRVKVYNVPANNSTFSERNPRSSFSTQPNTQQGYQNNSNRNLRPQRQYNNNEVYRQSRQLENRQREGYRRSNNLNNRSRNYNRPNNTRQRNTRQPNARQPIRRDNTGQRSNNRSNRNQSSTNNNRQQSRSSRGNSERQ